MEFLKSLVERGLEGVRLVTSDEHLGLKKVVQSVLVGASWQRFTIHFTRNCVAKAPKAAQSGISAVVRRVFAQPDRTAADGVRPSRRHPRLTLSQRGRRA